MLVWAVLVAGVPNSEVPVVVVPAVPPNRVLVAGALVVAPPKLPKRDMVAVSIWTKENRRRGWKMRVDASGRRAFAVLV